MDVHPLANLTQAVRKFGIVKHLKRQMFLSELVGAMVKSRSVIFSELADKIEREAMQSSIERRIQDFFQKVEFDYQKLLVLLACFIPHEQVVLSIDRTEWDRGSKQYNILCVIASIGKMGVPLYFEMLDNKSGNSNSEDRIKIIKRVMTVLGSERIGYLVMDREFIGHKWLRWLKKEGVRFCVRVPKHHSILFADGERTFAEPVLDREGTLCAENVVVDKVAVNLCISRGKNGELLYLIGNIPAKELRAAYRKRWSIEVFFQALKSRGFNLEKSGLRCLDKMRKLFAVTCIAYAICWGVAIQDAKVNAAKPKKHGYPQYSVFRRGLNLLRFAFKKGLIRSIAAFWQCLNTRVFTLTRKTVG